MNLREFLIGLEDFAKVNPEALELPVAYSVDDEGNAAAQVLYSPSIVKSGDFEGLFVKAVLIN